MLSIRGVAKRCGTLTAVIDLGLEAPAGTVHALLAPDGAGEPATNRSGAAAPARGGRGPASTLLAPAAVEECAGAGASGARMAR